MISIHLKSEIQNFTKQRLTKINMLDLIKVLKTKIFYSHNLELWYKISVIQMQNDWNRWLLTVILIITLRLIWIKEINFDWDQVNLRDFEIRRRLFLHLHAFSV